MKGDYLDSCDIVIVLDWRPLIGHDAGIRVSSNIQSRFDRSHIKNINLTLLNLRIALNKYVPDRSSKSDLQAMTTHDL